MISEVQMKRYLPCSELNRLPVMFWIQPSVPNSTAPTNMWAMNKKNRRTEPMENFVINPTTMRRAPDNP